MDNFFIMNTFEQTSYSERVEEIIQKHCPSKMSCWMPENKKIINIEVMNLNNRNAKNN